MGFQMSSWPHLQRLILSCPVFKVIDDANWDRSGDLTTQSDLQVLRPLTQILTLNRLYNLGRPLALFVVTTMTWYKQEKDNSMYIKQDNLPALTALTLCFRFKPLVLNHNDKQGKTYITSISDPGMTSQAYLTQQWHHKHILPNYDITNISYPIMTSQTYLTQV